ncbi:hypothetical protein [Providencia sneebia]|uniref:Uncharacterized protein n=1 Tax=Providencia sneebia DSM 19967 TaxID=1141660 RepID=K8WLL6_9GAMM|nr:hypothetical protein [Providencia sneebia]EKT58357.1 hypothetical protein OO7_06534 [Providencia sneebia DSM 19967]
MIKQQITSHFFISKIEKSRYINKEIFTLTLAKNDKSKRINERKNKSAVENNLMHLNQAISRARFHQKIKEKQCIKE